MPFAGKNVSKTLIFKKQIFSLAFRARKVNISQANINITFFIAIDIVGDDFFAFKYISHTSLDLILAS
jgi:hypothetical protein